MSLPTMSILARGLVMLIKVYRLAISPYLPMSCRFQPTCSRYAAEAIARYGSLKGTWLAARRLARCHPWGGMGYDPVPAAAGDSGEQAQLEAAGR